MTIARRLQVDPEQARFYHINARCVRRAYLCGDGYEHRKEWIYKRLRLLVSLFPVELAGFSLMDNHYHLVIRFDPTAPLGWSAEEVVRRWHAIHPRCAPGNDQARIQEQLAALASDPAWVERHRQRFRELGWFMSELNETIAKRANREDGVTGHFWQSRYKCHPLLDQAAVLAAMAYVDLNPLRARKAGLPEESDYTAVRERILAARGRRPEPTQADRGRWRRLDRDIAHDRYGEPHPSWLMPISECIVDPWGEETSRPKVTLRNYLQLVDATGRQVRPGKRGAIDPATQEILKRLGLEETRWMEMMRRSGQICGTALGHLQARMAEAKRMASRWLANRCGLFAQSTA